MAGPMRSDALQAQHDRDASAYNLTVELAPRVGGDWQDLNRAAILGAIYGVACPGLTGGAHQWLQRPPK